MAIFSSKAWDAICWEPKPGETVPLRYFFRNRWFRGICYVLTCFTITLLYNGWPDFSKMLFRFGIYDWLCEEGDVAPNIWTKRCDDQNTSVQSLLQISTSLEFICALLAGISLDQLGPLLTGLVGCSCFVSAWIFLLYHGGKSVMVVVGSMLLGAAVNFIAFPCLILGELFPNYEGLAVSIVVAAQTACTLVTLILQRLWEANSWLTFPGLMWRYLGFVGFPIILLFLLTLPVKRPYQLVTSPNKTDENTEAVVSQESITDDGFTEGGAVKDKSQKQIGISTSVVHRYTIIKQILSTEFLLFTLYYIVQVLQFGYFNAAAESQFTQDVRDVLGYLMPTQAIIGALFGGIVEFTGTLFICFGLNISLIVSYVFIIFPQMVLQYISCVLFVVSNSYIYTVKYTYCQEIFPPTHFGSLVGLVGCIAGAAQLINLAITQQKTVILTSAIFICLGVALFAILGYLLHRQKKGITYANDSPAKLKSWNSSQNAISDRVENTDKQKETTTASSPV